MAKRKQKGNTEPDSSYILKLVLYLIVGSQWVFLVNPNLTKQIPLPLGLVVGLLFARHDHFRLDRKVEYALLLIAMFVGFWSQVGIYVSVPGW